MIFISYRRADSTDVTGRIYDHLVEEFGEDAVFKDVDSIPLGTDFRNVISDAVQTGKVLLAIIGKNWLNVTDEKGKCRLEDPNDFVRIELESALEKKMTMIPVLVSGATMPKAEQLPDSLKPLIYRNAISVRPDPDFRPDMARLIRAIKKIARKQSATSVKKIMLVGLTLSILGVSIFWGDRIVKLFSGGTQPKRPTQISEQKPTPRDTIRTKRPASTNILTDRVAEIKKRKAPQFSVMNGILVDAQGNPVSVIPTKNFGETLKSHKLILLHFTAASGPGIIRWMAEASNNSSTHLLIGRNGKVTQFVPLDYRAWHAGQSAWKKLTGLNSYSIGVTLENLGQLKKDKNEWKALGKVVPENEVDPKTIRKDTGWHQYTDEQIQTTIGVLSALVKAYSIKEIVGHEDVTKGRKSDPGPAFPWDEVRKAVFD